MCMLLHNYVGLDNLTIGTVTNDKISVMWNHAIYVSGCGPVLFNVTAVNLMNHSDIMTMEISEIKATFPHLQSNTSYSIIVTAVNRAGSISSLTIIVTTLPTNEGM